eukprot:TRINITY_DN87838_c0_g1_i1.p1 TRINITY_DN87838_c0_g1~~TRINITY_DN87838_c0_g1_i1.p1  ORF type:complete len:721 (-),score=132.99 TRINITY_DN87838_c0_g1_i1:91-2253(-)
MALAVLGSSAVFSLFAAVSWDLRHLGATACLDDPVMPLSFLALLEADDACVNGGSGSCSNSLRQLRGELLRDSSLQPEPGSCRRYGCGRGYFPSHVCQCNGECSAHGNCCPDFKMTCLDMKQGPRHEARDLVPARAGSNATPDNMVTGNVRESGKGVANVVDDKIVAGNLTEGSNRTSSATTRGNPLGIVSQDGATGEAARDGEGTGNGTWNLTGGGNVTKDGKSTSDVSDGQGTGSEIGDGNGMDNKFADSLSAEEYLLLVDTFLEKQPRQTFLPDGAGLLQTFGPGSKGGGFCGKRCKLPEPCPDGKRCRFDVYDNAVAAIYLIKRGKLREAFRILNAFLQLLYPPEKIKHLSFGPRDKIPSGRWLSLLAASYVEAEVRAGTYNGSNVFDGSVDTGNNAWVGLAFAHYAAASGESCFEVVARDILQALKRSETCNDKLRGFMARARPHTAKYRSTEHNIDMFALARILSDDDAEERAGTFVRAMFGRDATHMQSYTTGTPGTVRCDGANRPGPIPTDVQFWSLLADVDQDADHKTAALMFALQGQDKGGMLTTDRDLIGNATGSLEGLAFTNVGHGVQWENTASAVMAISLYLQRFGDHLPGINLSKHAAAMQDSLKTILKAYGSVLASIRGGNWQAYLASRRRKSHHRSDDYPGGSDTGFTWTYMRYPHTAATAWTGLMLLGLDANPFALPGKTKESLRLLARSDSLECLPPPGRLN